VTQRTVVLLIGDVAFFYDRNGLWHRHLPDNLRVIILNNHGGGIFKIIDGPASLPEVNDFFVGSQSLTAQNTAHEHGLVYYNCSNPEDLEKKLQTFFQSEHGPGILEIITDIDTNTHIFNRYKQLIEKTL